MQIEQIEVNWPLLQEMQFTPQTHAEPIEVPLIVLRLVQVIGVYAMQFNPLADSYPEVHWQLFTVGFVL